MQNRAVFKFSVLADKYFYGPFQLRIMLFCHEHFYLSTADFIMSSKHGRTERDPSFQDFIKGQDPCGWNSAEYATKSNEQLLVLLPRGPKYRPKNRKHIFAILLACNCHKWRPAQPFSGVCVSFEPKIFLCWSGSGWSWCTARRHLCTLKCWRRTLVVNAGTPKW